MTSGGAAEEPRRTAAEEARLAAGAIASLRAAQDPLAFALYFFGSYPAEHRDDKYRLVMAASEFADRHGFSAVWMPERHFNAFGGLSSNPAVLAASIAARTEQLQVRAGSAVAPLHHPVRLAEDWAMVDSLSGGRTGMAFGCGWHSNDFVFEPSQFERRQAAMDERLSQVRRLWRGDAVRFVNGAGQPIEPTLHPRPAQAELPVWLTIVNNIDAWRRAGREGHGVLTNLMGQSPDELAAAAVAYRSAWREAGHPGQGLLSLLVHTHLASDAEAAIERARAPFIAYLRGALGLFKQLVGGLGDQIDFEHLREDERRFLLERAYDNYVAERALIGSPDSVAPVIDRLREIGVDEIGAFVDFGVDAAAVIDGLNALDTLRRRQLPATTATNRLHARA